MSDLPSQPAGATVELRRTFAADANELWRAWFEPERLRRWLQPIEGVHAERVEVDARPGGGMVMEFGRAPGARVVLQARYRELRAPSRLEFELLRRDEPAGTEQRTLVRAEFEPRASGTLVALRHDGVRADERDEIRHAWRRCLGRLAGECPRSLASFYASFDAYPRFRSRFGGLWPDLSDTAARIAGKQALGVLDAADARRFRHWVEHGYVVLERAVAPELVDRLRDEVERSWTSGDPRLALEVFEDGELIQPALAPRYRDRPHKVLDYHRVSATARTIEFAPAIRRFLEQLFERPALAFQSLLFRWGSEQEMHQDSAYVPVSSPMEFVGCWIALEDVRPGSGELQYYDGSHTIPEYVFFERARARPPEYADDRDFLRWVRAQSEAAGHPLVRFHPKKGDALIWHADLVHGGAKRELPGATRHSLVTHFCPRDVEPLYLDEATSSGKREHAPGCWYSYPLRGIADYVRSAAITHEHGAWRAWHERSGPIRLGVSTCLLGENVRWDGGHKRDAFVVDELGRFVTWVSVCPEVELGMGVPRPTVRLVDDAVGDGARDGARMLSPETGTDFTEEMNSFAARRVAELRELGLDGYVLKKNSPSCGLARVKVYGTSGGARRDGVGLFARALLAACPHLPVEEEGRLADPVLRENFVERVFCRNRWRALVALGRTSGRLVEFWTAHKLLARAHDELGYRRLGALVGGAHKGATGALYSRFEAEFFAALAKKATPRKHASVLQHALGHLREHLDAGERAQLGEAIDDHRKGLVPLVVPLTLVRFQVRRHAVAGLLGQLYFDPHPDELMLRNRV